jgi:hypothetical protein
MFVVVTWFKPVLDKAVSVLFTVFAGDGAAGDGAAADGVGVLTSCTLSLL